VVVAGFSPLVLGSPGVVGLSALLLVVASVVLSGFPVLLAPVALHGGWVGREIVAIFVTTIVVARGRRTLAVGVRAAVSLLGIVVTTGVVAGFIPAVVVAGRGRTLIVCRLVLILVS
jgi:hypothetical protein